MTDAAKLFSAVEGSTSYTEMRADVEKSLKAQGFLAENESLHDDAELEVQIEERKRRRRPVAHRRGGGTGGHDDGRAARVHARVGPGHGAHAPLFNSSVAAAAAATAAAATELRLKPRCSRGWLRRKPLAEELRAAAKAANSDPAAKPKKGDTEVVMVNLDPETNAKFKSDVEKLKRDGEIPPSPERRPPSTGANQWPPSPGKDKPSAAAGSDAPANPIEPPNGALSSDSVGSRLGKSKGERLFERLSAAASASAEATDAEYAESLD